MDFRSKVVWVTGASSGIGEALAVAFSHEGARVIISSRSPERLEPVKKIIESSGGEVFVIPLDLTDLVSIRSAAEKVKQIFGSVDILVNNGGISQRSMVHETSLEVDRRIMEVDYFGAVALTKEMLPSMLEKKGGHIVVVSSVMGKIGFPVRSAYAAAKHALHGFFETLWAEYHTSGIHVTMVCPGMVRTNISYHALEGNGKEHGIMDKRQAGGITPERCALIIMRGIRKDRREIYMGKEQVLIYLRRYFPWLFFRIVSKFRPT